MRNNDVFTFSFGNAVIGVICPSTETFTRFGRQRILRKYPPGQLFDRFYPLNPQYVRLTSTDYTNEYILVIPVAKRIHAQHFESYCAFVDPLDEKQKNKHGLPRMEPRAGSAPFLMSARGTYNSTRN